MKLNELSYSPGSSKTYVRRGRGLGSGLGKNGGSGNKGQKSRTGGGVRVGFEGGQNPIYRRVSKRGFTNTQKKVYAIVNVGDLEIFEDGREVCPNCMREEGLVNKFYDGVKVLGNDTLTKKLTVKAHKFSASAKEAIEKLGGTCVLVSEE